MANSAFWTAVLFGDSFFSLREARGWRANHLFGVKKKKRAAIATKVNKTKGLPKRLLSALDKNKNFSLSESSSCGPGKADVIQDEMKGLKTSRSKMTDQDIRNGDKNAMYGLK
jgi:hypothetical protein